jgi:hypothetical protein
MAFHQPGRPHPLNQAGCNLKHITRPHLSFEFGSENPGEDRHASLPLAFILLPLYPFPDQQGASLKHRLTEQHTRHKWIMGIMSLENIQIQGNIFFRPDHLIVNLQHAIQPEEWGAMRNAVENKFHGHGLSL